MARLPITIDSSTQQSVLPTAELQVQGNSPAAFGGDIGAGLQKVGAAGEDAASAYGQAQILKAKDQERLANFDRQTQFINFGSDQSQKLEQSTRDLSGPADGFTATAAGAFDADAKQFLDAIPEHQRPEWQAKMAQLRSGYTRQALAAEFAQRDTYYKQTTDDTLGKLANGAMTSPDKLGDWQAQGEQIIDASGLSADDKVARKLQWKTQAQLAAAQGMIQQNPDAALTALGGTNPPTKVDVKQGGDALQRMYAITSFTESHDNPDAVSPKGARGAMQVMPTTQILPGFGVHPLPANATKEQVVQQGRDYLSAMVTRYDGDPAKGWAAYNAGPGALDKAVAKATQNGNPNNYLSYLPLETRNYVRKNMAQLGPVGQQTAAAAAPGTASDAPPPGQAPAVDPRFADLPSDTRNSLIEASERQIDKREAVAAAAQQQQHDAWWNQFQTDLHDGKAGQADIDTARKTGVLTDYSEISKADDILKSTNKVDANLAYYNQVVNMPGYKFNPFDPKDKGAVDAAVKQAQTQGVDPAVAALAIWQKTRILGDAGAVAIRGNLVSTDPRAVQTAANVAGNMVRTNPNAFAGVSGGEDIEKAGFKFNHYTFDLGMSPDAAAQRLASENAPAYKAKVAVGDPALDAVRADIRKNGVSSTKIFGGGIFSSPPAFASPRQQAAANDDYAEMVVDNMRSGVAPDRATAEAMAGAQMKKVWGVDNFGQVRKYPPELSYPEVGGDGHAYLYRQAAQDVQQSTGAKGVKPEDVRMVPIPGVTDADFRNGAPARYHIVFGHDVNGQHVYDVAPGQWAGDVGAARTASQVNVPTDAQARADESTTREAAARYGAHAAAMAASARGQDPQAAAAAYLAKSGLSPAATRKQQAIEAVHRGGPDAKEAQLYLDALGNRNSN